MWPTGGSTTATFVVLTPFLAPLVSSCRVHEVHGVAPQSGRVHFSLPRLSRQKRGRQELSFASLLR